MKRLSLGVMVLLAGSIGYAKGKKEKAPEKSAAGTIESKSGSKATGSAKFTAAGDKVTLKVEVEGATPGDHAVHVHEKGDCSDADGKAAGGHWNPTPTAPNDAHGKWGTEHFHLG